MREACSCPSFLPLAGLSYVGCAFSALVELATVLPPSSVGRTVDRTVDGAVGTCRHCPTVGGTRGHGSHCRGRGRGRVGRGRGRIGRSRNRPHGWRWCREAGLTVDTKPRCLTWGEHYDLPGVKGTVGSVRGIEAVIIEPSPSEGLPRVIPEGTAAHQHTHCDSLREGRARSGGIPEIEHQCTFALYQLLRI